MSRCWGWLWSGCLIGWLSGGAAAQQPPAKADDNLPDKVSFYKDIRPIFQQHCQGCHQPAKAQGGYVMTSFAELFKKTDRDVAGIVPGQPERSAVYQQITPRDGKPPAMPRDRDPLSPRDVLLVKRWIEQGAADDTPASARAPEVDMDHPPVYILPPVITGLAYSPSGEYLAVTGYHETLLHRIDDKGQTLVARLVGLAERVQSVAFSPDGKWLAAVGGSPGRFGEVQLWDVAKKRLKYSLTVTFDTLYGASWSPDGKLLAFGGGDNSVRAIDVDSGKQVLFQGAHNDWVFGTVFSTKGTHLVSVSRDRSMKLTEVATARLEDNITSITPGALKGGLQSVDRHPTKDELVIGGADGVPKTYQMYRTKARMIGDDFNLIRTFPAMAGRIFAVKYSPDGNRIAAGSSHDGKGEVRIFQAADAKLVATLEGERGPVYALAFRPDGKMIASAGFDGVVRINDPNDGKLMREFVPVPLASAIKTTSK
ncbi:MAG: LpqB family beta-propeller domain-containing protein [Gemmataceae bacterium]|nr:LpqB family beta-propeller domain-containing protein [Gemmataceae bacterium]